jgi:hypothetical protein
MPRFYVLLECVGLGYQNVVLWVRLYLLPLSIVRNRVSVGFRVGRYKWTIVLLVRAWLDIFCLGIFLLHPDYLIRKVLVGGS